MMGADTATQTIGSIPLPPVVAAIAVLGTIAVAAMTAAAAKFGEAAARRRDGYAEADRNLVRWVEYSYRIRRRTSDDPTTLTALTAEGHALQEDLRCSETWLTADKAWAGTCFRDVRKAMGSSVGAACAEAWRTPPVRTAEGMNLNGFGPHDAEDELLEFERVVRFRVGLRRLVAPVVMLYQRGRSRRRTPRLRP